MLSSGNVRRGFYPTALSRMELKSIGLVHMAGAWNVHSLVLPPQLYWNQLILAGNCTASQQSQEWLVLCLKILKKTSLFLSPNTYTPPNNSGVMHNDQLKDYNEFSDCFPQQSPVWVLAIMVWLVPFHYSRWLEVDLCFNHPLIELVRLNDF